MKIVDFLMAEQRQLFEPAGYRVHFERRDDGVLISDHCPEVNEALMPSLSEAWELARRISVVIPNAVNIYVVDQTWLPVAGYRERMLRPHPGQGDW